MHDLSTKSMAKTTSQLPDGFQPGSYFQVLPEPFKDHLLLLLVKSVYYAYHNTICLPEILWKVVQ